MSTLFISYSTKDRAAAADMYKRAVGKGFHAPFLDYHPEAGIPAGAEWERTLYCTLRGCRALLVLYSKNWRESRWCFAELVYAKMMGKHVFPIVIDPSITPSDIDPVLAEYQAVYPCRDREAAYDRLWKSLDDERLDPYDDFGWDFGRSPYPGLNVFTEKDAGVYFGRDDEIREVTERLRRMRNQGQPRMLMIVGSSGAGKSSLLRAGVLPRLRTKANATPWLILPTLRWAEAHSRGQTLNDALAWWLANPFAPEPPPQDWPWRDWQQTQHRLTPIAAEPDAEAQALIEAVRDLLARGRPDATPVLVVDQFEELLLPTAGEGGSRFLQLLRQSLSAPNSPLLAIGTLRSDFQDLYDRHALRLDPLLYESYGLRTMPRERFADVIRRPGERVEVTFEETLVQRMVADTSTEDALPLLAFTLRLLYDHRGSNKRLTLDEYQALEGLEGSVKRAAQEAFDECHPTRAIELAVRECFVMHLTQSGEQGGEVTRRPAKWSDLPAESRPVLDKFIEKRLLTSRGEGAERYVEVAHEAIFRRWDRLKQWLDESRDILHWRAAIKRDWSELQSAGLRGAKLAQAKPWLKDRREELSKDERELIRRGISRERWTQRAMALIAAVILVLAIAAGYFGCRSTIDAQAARQSEREAYRQLASVKWNQAFTQRDYDLQPLKAAWSFLYAAEISLKAEDPTAARSALLAERGLDGTVVRSVPLQVRDARVVPATGQLFTWGWGPDVLVWPPGEKEPIRIWKHDANLCAVAFSGDERRVFTWSDDGKARLWNVDSREPLHVWTDVPASDTQSHVSCSRDGRRVLVWTGDGTVRLLTDNSKRPHATWEGTAALFSLDEQRALTWGPDNAARLWDVQSGRKIREWRHVVEQAEEPSQVRGAAFAPNNRFVLTWSNDNRVRLWDVEADQPVHTCWHDVSVYYGTLRGATFSDDGQLVVTWGSFGEVRLWSVGSDQPQKIWLHERTADERDQKQTAPYVQDAIFSRDNRRVLSWSSDGAVRLWDVDSPQPVRRWQQGEMRDPSTLRQIGASFSKDNQRVLTWGDDGTAQLWDVNSDTPRRIWRHDRSVSGATFDRDERRVLTWSDDGRTRLWDKESGRPLAEWKHDDRVSGAIFDRTEERVLTWGNDGIARFWNIPPPDLLSQWDHSLVSTAAFGPNESRVLSLGNDELKLWDVGTNQFVQNWHHPGGVDGVVFSGNGCRLLSWSNSYESLCLWSVDSRQAMQKCDGQAVVFCRRPGENRRRVLTRGKDGTTQLWDVESDQRPLRTWRSEAEVYGVAFSADESRLAAWSRDGKVMIWDIASDGPLQQWTHDFIIGAGFDRDGRRVLTWGNDGKSRLWDVTSDRPVHTWSHDEPTLSEGAKSVTVLGAQFNRDERCVLTWSTDRTARLWEVKSGKCLRVWRHRGAVEGASFSEDGDRIGTWSEDETIRVWDARSDQPLREWHHDTRPGGRLAGASFSRDCRRVLTWPKQGNHVGLWDLGSQELVRSWDQVNGVTGAMFSPNELMVLSWSQSGSARLWDVTQDQWLVEWKHTPGVTGARFTRDSRRALTWGQDGMVRLWDLWVDLNIPIEERKWELEVRTGTTMDNDGRYKVLNWQEWSRQVRLWEARRPGTRVLELPEPGV
ncbi:MAG: AAA family ATPase [Pirellulaceae bacterium]|nr:AAA family ATPase [Pirellulaceae bacterium]